MTILILAASTSAACGAKDVPTRVEVAKFSELEQSGFARQGDLTMSASGSCNPDGACYSTASEGYYVGRDSRAQEWFCYQPVSSGNDEVIGDDISDWDCEKING